MGAKHTQVGKFFRSDWGWISPIGKLAVHGADWLSDAFEGPPAESSSQKARRKFFERGARMQPDVTDQMLRVFQDQSRQRTGRTRQSLFETTLLGGDR